MDTLPPDLISLLADLRAALDGLYGERLVELLLYSSQARGDTHGESDVDVLVVLDGPVQPGREIRRMGDVRTRLGIQHEQALSLLPVSEKEYRENASGWSARVHKEGKAI